MARGCCAAAPSHCGNRLSLILCLSLGVQSRTATGSLTTAPETPGLGPCHHPFEVRDHPEQLPARQAATRGGRVDWDPDPPQRQGRVDADGAHRPAPR